MSSHRLRAPFALLLSAIGAISALFAPACLAQAKPAAAASAPAAIKPHVRVFEDDGVRIEETRSGGVVRRVTVQSKIGQVAPYEIQLAPHGRDPNQERGSAGKRTWSLFDF